MRKTALILSAILFSCVISAQGEPDVKVEPTVFKGQLMILTDNSLFDKDKPDNFYFNFGGPSLRINRGKTSAGLCFAPSMKMQFNDGSVSFAPTLGFGGDIGYQRIVFGLTEYYNAKTATWNLAAGFGFRFK
jgi:hypothetical protein